MKANILLILSDQQRADTLGFAGKTGCRTPKLDHLAADGISFDRAITPAPLCGPARACIFTGKYAHQDRGVLLEDKLGIRTKEELPLNVLRDMMINDSSLREEPLLTRLLKKAGYHTAYAGKWHLGNDIIGNWFDKYRGHNNAQYVHWCRESGLPDGWPLNDSSVRTHRVPHMSIPITKVNDIPPEHGNDAWITDIALRFLGERPKDKPFFAVCSFNGPHPPFKIPEPYFSMYDPHSITEPLNFRPSDGEPACKAQSFYRLLWRDHGERWEPWQKSHAVYWGFVSYIDHQVGRLVEYLRREGELENTWIIYASDHGEMLGQHGLWHKMQAYEESLRVPLIIRPPGGATGIRSDAPASLIDIPSSILSAAGIQAPREYEGIDLLTALENGGRLNGRTHLYSAQAPLGAFHKEVDWRMVTDNRFKYIWNNGDREELYDLQEDPLETRNLADTRGDLLKGLRVYLLDWMIDSHDPLLQAFKVQGEAACTEAH
jgi:arylsulfatase A-like enzyme